MAGRKNDVDWDVIMAEYLQGDLSQEALAEKHQISYHTLRYHARKEKWKERKAETHQNVTKKLPEIIGDSRAEFLKGILKQQDEGTELLFRKLLEGIKKHPDGAGTKIIRETIDVKTIKQEDGTEKSVPLKSSITSDIESAARTLTTLGKHYGLDAASILAQQRYEAEQERDGKLPDIEDEVIFDEIRKCMEDRTP